MWDGSSVYFLDLAATGVARGHQDGSGHLGIQDPFSPAHSVELFRNGAISDFVTERAGHAATAGMRNFKRDADGRKNRRPLADRRRRIGALSAMDHQLVWDCRNR